MSKSEPITIITTPKDQFVFGIPNDFCKWRADTLFKKEPETIKWLSNFRKEDIFWDVGANIGLYSIFAAVRVGCQVFSFEPESQNFAQLCKNIHYNKVNHLVNGYCVGISDETSVGNINLSQLAPGHSGHTIDINASSKITQGCVIYSIDDLIKMGLPCPTRLKIDIDGLEPLVLNGCRNNFNRIISILIEINQDDRYHLEMIKTLTKAGFSFSQDQVDRTARPKGDKFENVREYIFTRLK